MNHKKVMTMEKPMFSILMPAYNVEAYIRDTVGCIMGQSFKDWELVLVDDCSTDGTADIIRQLASADSRIKVSFRSGNAGKVHVPRCDAAALATGEYVVPVDADDMVDSDFLRKLRDRIAETSADLVIPGMWRFSDEEQPYKILPKDDFDMARVWKGRDLVRHTLVEWKIPMAGFACRRNLYLSGTPSLTDEDSAALYADELFSRILLCRSGKVAFCDGEYLYRMNPTSITSLNADRYGAYESDRSLVGMMVRLFGEGSEEHLLAEEQLFFGAVGALRKLNAGTVSPEVSRTLMSHASAVVGSVDVKSLRGRVSGRYLALMSLPLPIARIALKWIDRVMSKTGFSFHRH